MTKAAITAYLAAIGKKGGSAGTGKAKKRGGSAYYRALAAKRGASDGAITDANAQDQRQPKKRETAAKTRKR